jgi:hypothetical protein
VHRLRPERRGGVLQHLQPCSRRTVRHGQKKDGFGAVGMEEAGADGTSDPIVFAFDKDRMRREIASVLTTLLDVYP